ncbi:retron-type reverse transcriptase [Paenibacillus sp. MSJ-34]|uniref:retron-type reverse transcriptase n=1 Tax=Paenibacillus sp. MSJ-34 TaxID=2841529 RepID=UPI001C0F4A13|nr:retron-type reverse transcriptase [Paenibacillus sp. MSJ-34]MBU5441218.1 retron-type reverse transcriptase [Paenibacillus sp. MSJ-34]
MKRDEINQIKKTAKEYASEALRSRKAFLELRLRQDPEIRKIFIRAASRISSILKQGGTSRIGTWLLTKVEHQLLEQGEQLRDDLTESLKEYIESGVEIGSRFNRAVSIDLLTNKVSIPRLTKTGIDRMYFRVNVEAVRACWERTHKGLKLSDRIWEKSAAARDAMRDIIQDAVATGQDAVTTARMLERYVKEGANVEAKYFEGMMKRMGTRIPEDISYPALRLARTETTAAFGQGTILSAQVSPSCNGIRFCLSPSHRIRDVCDELASHDIGLGLGVYSKDDPPPYPAHPNTLSYLVEVHQDSKDFVRNLKQWIQDPKSQPEINDWYENVYSAA